MKALLLPLFTLALATLGFAQQPTLPVEREITDVQGRQMAGTVLAVTNGSIEFSFANGSKRTILLQMLPEKDRKMIEAAKSLPVYFTFPATGGPETVEVLKRTETSIKFRRASDGQAFDIPLSKMSRVDREWVKTIPFRWPRPTGIGREKKPDGLGMALSRFASKMKTADTKTLQKMLQDNHPELDTWVAEMAWRKRAHNHPEYHYGDPIPYLIKMEIKDPEVEEQVSLRKEFEEAVVRSVKQTKNACSLYSGYNLYKYLLWKNGTPPIGFEEFKTTADSFEPDWPAEMLKRSPTLEGSYFRESSIKTVLKLRGVKPTVVMATGINDQMQTELMKDFLRNGNPIWVSFYNEVGNHTAVITGFKTRKASAILYEVLESKGPGSGDQGYEWKHINPLSAWVLLLKE